jgi:hypothetical protein
MLRLPPGLIHGFRAHNPKPLVFVPWGWGVGAAARATEGGLSAFLTGLVW